MKRVISKAVIPAAGRGTRLLPATKAVPKEMLPVAGKPMIHLCLEEAVAAGVKEVCIVLNPRKAMVKDYFCRWPRRSDVEKRPLKRLRALLKRCRLSFVWQEKPRGLADAIDRARDFVGGEPFALMLPDNLVFGREPVISQIGRTFGRYGTDTVGVARIPSSRAPTFSLSGRIDYETASGRGLRVTGFHRKKQGGYWAGGRKHVVRMIARAIFLPHFFDYIDIVRKRIKGELDDVPVIREIARRNGMMGHLVEGTVFDVGNPRGYAAANEWMIKTAEG